MSSKITFLGFRGHSPLSKVIQKVTKGPYSHVAYVVGNHYSWKQGMVGPVVIEAWQGWVRMVDINTSHRPGTVYDVIELTVPERVSFDFDRVLEGTLYRRYDFLAIVNFLIGKSVLDDPKKFFCSELLTYAAEKVDMLHVPKPCSFVSPTDFVQSLFAEYSDAQFVATLSTWRRA